MGRRRETKYVINSRRHHRQHALATSRMRSSLPRSLVSAQRAAFYRDVVELVAERGIEVDHVTIYRWMQSIQAA
jgi:hypothetical protein